MAIQLAAALMPVIKKVGMEVASEVATKMVWEELQRQKKRLQNTANGIPNEPLPKTGIKIRTKQLGTCVANEVLESRALNTSLGAVLGTVTAVSTSMCKAEEPLLNQRGKNIQKEENRKQQRKDERQSASIKMHR